MRSAAGLALIAAVASAPVFVAWRTLAPVRTSGDLGSRAARWSMSGGPTPEEHTVTRIDPNVPHHPVVLEHRERRAADMQLRIADAITAFAGSMRFVYIHAIGFALWMLFVESDPWPKLTLIVSLEAIFLSTFVMIGQNRAAAFQQAKADHDFTAQEMELKTNTELTRAVHELTKDIHTKLIGQPSP
jgi:uncharacterized membrane protein